MKTPEQPGGNLIQNFRVEYPFRKTHFDWLKLVTWLEKWNEMALFQNQQNNWYRNHDYFQEKSSQTKSLFGNGGDAGLVILTFYSDDPSLNPTYSYLCKI